MFSLAGKVAVITGGGSGIGKATAERFVAAGAKVVLADLSDTSDLAEELGGIAVQTNVSDGDSVRSALQAAIDSFGKLDILVNNAGIATGYRDLAETDIVDFDRCYQVNTLGVVHGLKHANELMSDGGAIINLASLAATRGVMSISPYVASKHAVVGLTKTAALEFAPHIRVNCICPTTVRTPMAYADDGEAFMEAEKDDSFGTHLRTGGSRSPHSFSGGRRL